MKEIGIGVTVALVVIAVVFAAVSAVFGLMVLNDALWPDHMTCVQAHDEFHKSDGGGDTYRVCDKWVRH